MPVIPLLPLFHKFNSQYFENSLTVNNQPLVKVRWSDNRLKTTAGFYKRKRINGFIAVSYTHLTLPTTVIV